MISDEREKSKTQSQQQQQLLDDDILLTSSSFFPNQQISSSEKGPEEGIFERKKNIYKKIKNEAARFQMRIEINKKYVAPPYFDIS